MRELSFAELRGKQLEIFLEFVRFCDDNNLTYFLGGGSLLGAIRHKGFIPWDDDIDVNMPRSDYEKLLEIFSSTKYEIKSVEKGDEKPLFAIIVDKNTKLLTLDGEEWDMANGVFIDIFPIDNMSNDSSIRILTCIFKELIIYCHEGAILSYIPTKRYKDGTAGIFKWKERIRTLIKYIFISIFKMSSGRKWGMLANKIARIWENKATDWAGCMITMSHYNHGLVEILPRKVFEATIEVEFEGYKVKAPIGYDDYLRSLYGDYMKLPPKEKRVSHHEFKAYLLE